MTGLDLSGMASLNEVYVWDGFIPDYRNGSVDDVPSNVVLVDTTGSPNVTFETVSAIGIKEQNNGGVTIYPNPSYDIFTVEIEAPIHGELQILSLNGQVIHSRTIRSTSEQIDLSNYAKGIYFVTVRSDAWVRMEKVVKYRERY